ncbi:MAG: diacylglycerol kinase family lipid kinase [Bacteroidales bacterium]|nr:diacylglycerol kinase family lipid kinase [Bacteroidales bacterium]
MTKKQILFVVNPKSGLGRKSAIETEIKHKIDKSKYEFDIIHTKHRGHATEIAAQHRDKADAIIAVGGDGTVNEVGAGLVGSTTALGIIPCGSGNGLARELDIPLRTSSSIEVINEFETKSIDILKVGDRYSLNVAGIGFDAYISHLFADKKRRGPLQYMNLIAREFPKYKAQNYVLNFDGDIFFRTAFLISFANSSQWGNNIHIAPNARIDDGLMDVCMVSEFPNYAIPALVISLLNQSIDTNKYDEMIRTKSVTINSDCEIPAHVDGEPFFLQPYSKIEIIHLGLNVIKPSADYFESLRFMPALLREQILSTRDQFRNTKDQILTRVKETSSEIKQIFKDK